MKVSYCGSRKSLPDIIYDPNSLRPPSQVMKLERLGSFHQTRISFVRTLIRRMNVERWTIRSKLRRLDNNGYGDLVYEILTPQGTLNFIAYSNPLADKDRTDRVIAEKWDMAFVLFNGNATEADIERLRTQVPKQESGRMSANEIVLSRANKSVRLFNSVIDSLAAGSQPSATELAEVGYLIRTTAVYGNGKFGLMDFCHVRHRTPFELPFQAELLTVYMARTLSFEMVEHIAQQRAGNKASKLDRVLKRSIGVGNATGLGMAPFLVGHPQLINRWILLREIAICRIKTVAELDDSKLKKFNEVLKRAIVHVDHWQTDDERQLSRIDTLKDELRFLSKKSHKHIPGKTPWKWFLEWLESNMSLECVELVHSIVLEIYPEYVNDLDQYMSAEESPSTYAHLKLDKLCEILEEHYAWAFEHDFRDRLARHYFWYVSEEKEEPRLGERFNEPGANLELKIGIAQMIVQLHEHLLLELEKDPNQTVAGFLLKHPEFRFIIARACTLSDYPYAEIQENLLAADCLPINMLRCKLALFGATRFDPKSDRWTRITLFQGAPLVDELDNPDSDDWAFPVMQLH